MKNLPKRWFQHTAARRRLSHISKHCGARMSFNTQPPEGGCPDGLFIELTSDVSTHSRPKAAAFDVLLSASAYLFQHTAARRRLAHGTSAHIHSSKFQHTAARRRLLNHRISRWDIWVSTHSRPKAADKRPSE